MKLKSKIVAFSSLILILAVILAVVPYGGLKTTANNETSRPVLVPGGMPFGVKIYTKGVVIIGITDIETATGLHSPGKECNLSVGDVITAINGSEINTIETVTQAVKNSNGKRIDIEFIREEKTMNGQIVPVKSIRDDDYKIGLWIRDSAAGIGTVTYVDSQNLTFGGLGHGITDSESGIVMPLLRGSIMDVSIIGVEKGLEYSPGELRGQFSNIKIGELSANTICGVFGKLDRAAFNLGSALEIAYRSEIREGKAYILTTVEGKVPSMYEIEISKVYPNSGDTKNMMLKITDKNLLDATGGIVQGMSGSPIIQNGRLVGAVTHVMINDPERGYGIFIENMLKYSA